MKQQKLSTFTENHTLFANIKHVIVHVIILQKAGQYIYLADTTLDLHLHSLLMALKNDDKLTFILRIKSK